MLYAIAMAFKLSKRDVAERILEVLIKDLRLKSGDRVPDHQLKDKYRAGGGDAGDIRIGLEYADTEEWLSYNAATEAWYITEHGHEYAL